MPDSASSSGSESCKDNLYEVERILAQEESDGQMLYLTKWRNYLEEESTWEPSENFTNSATLEEWRKRLSIGDSLDEDGVAALQARMNAYHNEQEEKRAGRSLKRRKLANDTLHSESTSSESDTAMTVIEKKAVSISNLEPTSKPKPPKSRGSPTTMLSMSSTSSKSTQSHTRPRPRSTAVSTFTAPTPLAGLRKIGAFDGVPDTKPPDKKMATARTLASHNETSRSSRKRTDIQSSAISHEQRNDSNTASASPAQKAAGPNTQSRAGEKFKSLSHQNNFMKRSRREGVPDISQLELRAPDEWSKQARLTSPQTSFEDDTNESWLFVPVDLDDTSMQPLQTQIREPAQQDIQLSSDIHMVPSPGRSIRHTHENTSCDERENSLIEHKPSLSERRLSLVSQSAQKYEVVRKPVVPTSEPASTEFPVPVVSTPTMSKVPQTLSQPGAHLSSSLTTMIPSPASLVTTKSGRQFRAGVELLVHLSLGDHAVGDVKVLNLPPWLHKKLLALKAPKDAVLGLQYEQGRVLNAEEWAEFASSSLAVSAIALGVIEAYEDTQRAAKSLAEYLEAGNACAVWFYPDSTETIAMILFSGHAASWRKHVQVEQSGTRLHVWVRNTRKPLHNGLSSARHLPVLSRSSALHQSEHFGNLVKRGVEAPRPYLHSAESRKPLAKQTHRRDTAQSQMSGYSATRTSSAAITSATTMDAEAHQIPLGLSTADFTQLTTVSSRFKGEACRPKVYLAFSDSHPYEAQMVRGWLCEHIQERNIYSSAEDGAWSEFLDGVEQKIGIVLFHQQVANYTSLPKLSSHLVKSESFMCFGTMFASSGVSFLRLFPRGTTLGVTESCVINFPYQTLQALQWFDSTSKGKQAYWKLLLFPSAIEFMMDRLTTSTDPKIKKSLADIVALILKLSIPFTKDLICEGKLIDDDQHMGVDAFDGLDDSVVLSPSQLLGYQRKPDSNTSSESALRARDKVFSEFFRGWAALNAMNYRRFMILDDKMTNKNEPYACHVKFQHPKQFAMETTGKMK